MVLMVATYIASSNSLTTISMSPELKSTYYYNVACTPIMNAATNIYKPDMHGMATCLFTILMSY